MRYYLIDGIYPKWPKFLKIIPSPQGNKKKYFAATHESTRKDIKNAFGILQQHFAIVHGLAQMFKIINLTNIMKACIILQNMIIEDECDDNGVPKFKYEQLDKDLPELSRNPATKLIEFIQRYHALEILWLIITSN
ncbi:hypothetical protein F2P56_032654 [Juglans regia]|uniref:Nuclease HARBI1 n=2 Tax=Juglans regia TaxID=51240 RepID=A0A833UAD7_JUGRE|nr:uncharacterized protein LOC109013781 [Juglans regia]KAF5447075.1 hypothetical protein F2P56_032654 [Juglans regia]